jgi:molybdate transport system substrate-binding protein
MAGGRPARAPGLVACGVLVVAWLSGVPAFASADTPVTVFAAASLSTVLEELGERIERSTGIPVRLSFASSSTLARQIEAGAEADIYASANQRWMAYLMDAGLIEDSSVVTPIGNRLVLIAPRDDGNTPLEIGPDLPLGDLLGEDGRLAIGDHAHVPAGIYAREALLNLGLWAEVEDRLALADDVRAALALVARGEAPLGIVYQTDAMVTDQVEILGTFGDDTHGPIRYPFAILAGHTDERSRAVFDALTSAEARPLYEAAGFMIP